MAALVAGCGIRTTSVPVDAGAAPSRVPCSTAEDGTTGTTGVPVRVFLVCGSQLETVERRSPLPEGKADADPVRTARLLLTQLLAVPSESERRAGFTTAVRGPLTVGGGHRDDPAGTLRLSRQPEDLAPVALSQLVCSFAESSAGTSDRTVLLGGPGPYAPKRYRCTTELRERPESAPPTAPPPTATASASASASGSVPGSPTG
ncbi:lipoprotein [Streptomyces sp. NRRL F-6491]|nr:lipoprotein [Streptomyces sp. NRRL F-6491]KOX50051.1 lipoprotein [Streptomyces sp. NRRL F-6492]